MYEYLGPACIRVQGRRYAADVVPVTQGEQRQEADGRVFRLIGVGVSDLCPSTQADPPDLFQV